MKRRSIHLGAFSISVGTFAVFAIAACGSSSNSGTGDTSTLGGFINSYCSYVGSCCGSQGQPSDGSQCRVLLEFSNITNYDATKGQACIAAVQSAASSDPSWCIASPSTTSAACDQATSSGPSGTVAPGGKCNTAADCAGAPTGDTVVCQFPPIIVSNSDGGNAEETCVVQVHGKAGDGPCAGTVEPVTGGTSTSFNNNFDAGASSGPEVFCFVSDGVSCSQTSSQCVALAQIGDSCQGGAQCVSGSHCDFTSEKCAANAATGDACQLDSDCTTGDYCDTTAKTCAARAATGAACTTGNQCTSEDCSNGKCGAGFGASFGLALLCGGSDGG
jgi:Dickkopf N-terminal cysteine-rich region